MIACKYGRDENVKELLAMEDQNVSDMEDDHEEVIKKPRVVIDVKNRHTKAAIHYAAKHGHLVSTGVVSLRQVHYCSETSEHCMRFFVYTFSAKDINSACAFSLIR